MDLKKDAVKRNCVPGFPPIPSADSSVCARNLKTLHPSYSLLHGDTRTNHNNESVPTSALKVPSLVRNNREVPAILQAQPGGKRKSKMSSKSSHKLGKNLLRQAYTPLNSANSQHFTKTVSCKRRNETTAPAGLCDINEPIKFTIKSKMMLMNTGENNLGQRSILIPGNKMAPSRNVSSSFPERIEGNRRSAETASPRHLLKMKALEHPFSIRNTINKFRKWHFEQNVEKINTFTNTQDSQQECVDKNLLTEKSLADNEFVRMFETKIAQGRNVEFNTFAKDNNYNNNNNCAANLNEEYVTDKILNWQEASENGPTHLVSRVLCHDKNESEAHNNMKSYIQGNDLVNIEREQWIQIWVAGVQALMEQTGRELCETFE